LAGDDSLFDQVLASLDPNTPVIDLDSHRDRGARRCGRRRAAIPRSRTCDHRPRLVLGPSPRPSPRTNYDEDHRGVAVSVRSGRAAAGSRRAARPARCWQNQYLPRPLQFLADGPRPPRLLILRSRCRDLAAALHGGRNEERPKPGSVRRKSGPADRNVRYRNLPSA
jgi:hypothetical protein